MKEKTKNVLGLLAIIVVGIILGCNMYETSFYSYSWGKAKMNLSFEDVSKITCSYIDANGDFIVLEYATEEELAIWKNFFDVMNKTTFSQNVSSFGGSFYGLNIEISTKEHKLFRITFSSVTRVQFDDFIWDSSEKIEIPIECNLLGKTLKITD